jgi:hypothetical protein
MLNLNIASWAMTRYLPGLIGWAEGQFASTQPAQRELSRTILSAQLPNNWPIVLRIQKELQGTTEAPVL